MGASLSGGGAGCDQEAEQHQAGSPANAPACGGDSGPAPQANSNEQTRGGQQSTNTFDTSLQRTNIMGISPLHM
jgi:hypothetical protein